MASVLAVITSHTGSYCHLWNAHALFRLSPRRYSRHLLGCLLPS